MRDSPGRWRLDSEWSGPVLHQTPCQDGGRGEAALLASTVKQYIISDKGVLAGVIISVVITTILLSLGLCTFVRYFLR